MIKVIKDPKDTSKQHIYRKSELLGEVRYKGGYYESEPVGGKVVELISEGASIMAVANFKREEQLV